MANVFIKLWSLSSAGWKNILTWFMWRFSCWEKRMQWHRLLVDSLLMIAGECVPGYVKPPSTFSIGANTVCPHTRTLKPKRFHLGPFFTGGRILSGFSAINLRLAAVMVDLLELSPLCTARVTIFFWPPKSPVLCAWCLGAPQNLKCRRDFLSSAVRPSTDLRLQSPQRHLERRSKMFRDQILLSFSDNTQRKCAENVISASHFRAGLQHGMWKNSKALKPSWLLSKRPEFLVPCFTPFMLRPYSNSCLTSKECRKWSSYRRSAVLESVETWLRTMAWLHVLCPLVPLYLDRQTKSQLVSKVNWTCGHSKVVDLFFFLKYFIVDK